MSFDIARTPTLHAVATEDESMLAHDLQSRVDEAIQQARAQADVVESIEAQRAAEEHRTGLQKAERVLSQSATGFRDLLAELAKAALEVIIQSVITKGQPNFAKLDELSVVENRHRHTNRAIERIVEHLIPLSQIACLREESHALMTTARAVERIAQERAEKVLGRLKDAVSEEMVLPVDMSKGVAGALIAHAGGLKHRAIQASEEADRLDRAYRDRNETAA